MRNAIQWNHLNGDISLRHSLNDAMVSLSRAKVSHHARAFPGFRSIKRLGVLLLLPHPGQLKRYSMHNRVSPRH